MPLFLFCLIVVFVYLTIDCLSALFILFIAKLLIEQVAEILNFAVSAVVHTEFINASDSHSYAYNSSDSSTRCTSNIAIIVIPFFLHNSSTSKNIILRLLIS